MLGPCGPIISTVPEVAAKILNANRDQNVKLMDSEIRYSELV